MPIGPLALTKLVTILKGILPTLKPRTAPFPSYLRYLPKAGTPKVAMPLPWLIRPNRRSLVQAQLEIPFPLAAAWLTALLRTNMTTLLPAKCGLTLKNDLTQDRAPLNDLT